MHLINFSSEHPTTVNNLEEGMCISFPLLSPKDHIFGCGPDSTSGGRKTPTTVTFRDNNGGGGGLESPSRVLGGSTSWTGGLSHGCTAVFKNNETRTGLWGRHGHQIMR